MHSPESSHDAALYRRIVEDSPAAVVLLSNKAATRVLYASPRIADISGLAVDELIADPQLWLRHIDPDASERILAAWAGAVERCERLTAEYRFLRRDGQWRWLRDTSAPVAARDGSIRYRQSFIEDITSERFAEAQAERSEARYRALVERLPVIVYVDSDEPEPRSLYVSPNSEAILGYEPREFLADPGLWFDSMHPDDLPRVREAWAESIRSRRPFQAEYRDVKPDGSVVWVRDHSILVHDDEGSPLFWQGVLLDVTAEKQAEIAFADSERRYQALIEQLPAAVYLDERRGETSTIFVSSPIEQMTGIPAERWMSEPGLWERVIHPDDVERVGRSMASANEAGSSLDMEYRYVHADGRVVWVHDTAGPVLGPDDRPLYWLGVVTDVTASKEAEIELARSETRYRALVEQIPAIVYEMGPDDERRTLFVSPHVEELLGYPRQEWLDQPDIWTELLHADDRETELAAHDRHNETGESWERQYRLIASDGREVWVSDRAELVPHDEGARWLGVMLDITPQKHAEGLLQITNDDLEVRVLARTAELAEANEMMGLEIGERRRIERELRDAEERFRTLVEHIPGVVYTWRVAPLGETQAHPETYVSPHVEVVLGYQVDTWKAPGFWETRIHPHDRERVLAATRRSRETGEEFHEEFRYLAKDGGVVWVLDHASLTSRNADGSPRLFQGVMVEVTERKLAEEKAAAAEEQFQLIAERGPFVVYRYDLDHDGSPSIRMRYLSPSASELLGMPSERWSGDLEAWMQQMHPDDVERMRAAAEEAMSTGGPWNHVFRMIAGDGRVVWLLDRGQAIGWDEPGRPTRFQGVFLDVTDEQEALLETQAAEARYRSVLEAMPAVPWTEVVDPRSGASRYEFLGGQVGAVFGYTPEELQMEPDHFFRLVHPDDRDRLRAASDRCDRTGSPWDELYRVTHRDGSVHWILSRATRTFEDGRPVWHGVSLDVTSRIGTGGSATSLGRERGTDRV